jgi:hypothetical protein
VDDTCCKKDKTTKRMEGLDFHFTHEDGKSKWAHCVVTSHLVTDGYSLAWDFRSNQFYGLVISGVIFIIGEMLIVPTMDSAISRFGTVQMAEVIFGISNFVSGIGEGAGKFIGAQILSLGTMSPLPWLTFAISAAALSAIWILLKVWLYSGSSANLNITEDYKYNTFMDWLLGRKNKAR